MHPFQWEASSSMIVQTNQNHARQGSSNNNGVGFPTRVMTTTITTPVSPSSPLTSSSSSLPVVHNLAALSVSTPTTMTVTQTQTPSATKANATPGGVSPNTVSATATPTYTPIASPTVGTPTTVASPTTTLAAPAPYHHHRPPSSSSPATFRTINPASLAAITPTANIITPSATGSNGTPGASSPFGASAASFHGNGRVSPMLSAGASNASTPGNGIVRSRSGTPVQQHVPAANIPPPPALTRATFTTPIVHYISSFLHMNEIAGTVIRINRAFKQCVLTMPQPAGPGALPLSSTVSPFSPVHRYRAGFAFEAAPRVLNEMATSKLAPYITNLVVLATPQLSNSSSVPVRTGEHLVVNPVNGAGSIQGTGARRRGSDPGNYFHLQSLLLICTQMPHLTSLDCSVPTVTVAPAANAAAFEEKRKPKAFLPNAVVHLPVCLQKLLLRVPFNAGVFEPSMGDIAAVYRGIAKAPHLREVQLFPLIGAHVTGTPSPNGDGPLPQLSLLNSTFEPPLDWLKPFVQMQQIDKLIVHASEVSLPAFSAIGCMRSLKHLSFCNAILTTQSLSALLLQKDLPPNFLIAPPGAPPPTVPCNPFAQLMFLDLGRSVFEEEFVPLLRGVPFLQTIAPKEFGMSISHLNFLTGFFQRIHTLRLQLCVRPTFTSRQSLDGHSDADVLLQKELAMERNLGGMGIVQALAPLAWLTNLSLISVRISDAELGLLLPHFKFLNRLELSYLSLTSIDCLSTAAPALSHSLRTLQLSNCFHLEPLELENIWTLKSLTELNVSRSFTSAWNKECDARLDNRIRFPLLKTYVPPKPIRHAPSNSGKF